MFKKMPHIILMSLLSSSLLLTACKKADEPAKTEQHQTNSSTDQVMEKLNERPVKKFATTADDAHDITLLEDYDRRFTEMSDEMETELEKMHEAGTLTTEFEQKRTLDNVRSALTMLKDLDLKTEQGRYIQGLLYQYWENQEKHINDKQANKDEQVNQLADYLQAQNQLKYWKASQQH
ncbi:hypothetical protein [Acinetobacter sp. ABJ_C5_2]|uniref:hypothetical protein n=1 Tax=Acinetobacter sp. ABJ_C5_2 TaxID=3376992 RepID=UPI0037CAF2DA